jgi:hypothetical protein
MVEIASVARTYWPRGRWRKAREVHWCLSQQRLHPEGIHEPCRGQQEGDDHLGVLPAIVPGHRYYDTGLSISAGNRRVPLRLCGPCALRAVDAPAPDSLTAGNGGAST